LGVTARRLFLLPHKDIQHKGATQQKRNSTTGDEELSYSNKKNGMAPHILTAFETSLKYFYKTP